MKSLWTQGHQEQPREGAKSKMLKIKAQHPFFTQLPEDHLAGLCPQAGGLGILEFHRRQISSSEMANSYQTEIPQGNTDLLNWPVVKPTSQPVLTPQAGFTELLNDFFFNINGQQRIISFLKNTSNIINRPMQL